MNAIPSIAQSGMNAAMLHVAASANNIANAMTPGYTRQTVLQEAAPEGGVVVHVGRASQPGDDLAADIVGQMIASYSFQANLGVIKTHDAMLGSLLDLKA